MPVAAADIQTWSSANMPEDDTSLAGGAISTVDRPELTQFSATAALVLVSDGADVRTGTAVFRLDSGLKVTQTFTLNGATEVTVAGGNAERVIRVTLDSTSATRTVSIKQGVGGTVRGTIPPNETTRRILFGDSISEAGISTRYTLIYKKNAHATLALTSAAEKLTADPAIRAKMGLGAAKGSLGTFANRKTAPGGISFVDDNVAVGVPSGNLGAGEFIGVYFEVTLPANDPPNRTTFTSETSGAST